MVGPVKGFLQASVGSRQQIEINGQCVINVPYLADNHATRIGSCLAVGHPIHKKSSIQLERNIRVARTQ
jgi:hypothetical protein